MARILIADDDAEVRQSLAIALVDRGHEVAAVLDGHKATASLTDVTHDLILLDVMMRGKDGFVVLEELNATGARDLTRVLMLTSKSSEDDARRAFELGADAYVTKPFDPAEVVKQVEELLALSSEELRISREKELDRSRLLSQLESILGEG
jgi:two-component system response regulator MtrA